MNKQELIRKLKTIDGGYGSRCYIAMNDVFELIKQLDEPQKVTVPQFVADWYEEHKDDFETNLFRAVDLIPSDYEEDDLSEFEEWLVDDHTEPFQTLVNMHQFGYEVKKEKRYTVKMKGVISGSAYLKQDAKDNYWYFGTDSEKGSIVIKHTREEIEKAGFGWVFDCEGIELEEVEE